MSVEVLLVGITPVPRVSSLIFSILSPKHTLREQDSATQYFGWNKCLYILNKSLSNYYPFIEVFYLSQSHQLMEVKSNSNPSSYFPSSSSLPPPTVLFSFRAEDIYLLQVYKSPSNKICSFYFLPYYDKNVCSYCKYTSTTYSSYLKTLCETLRNLLKGMQIDSKITIIISLIVIMWVFYQMAFTLWKHFSN